MTAWSETCRGSVAPWQCDVTEHFTIGCYFDRLGEAGLEYTEEMGLGEVRRAALAGRRFFVRFVRELRAGAAYHVESALIGFGSPVRFGHRFVDSANGEVVTWIEESWDAPLPAGMSAALAANLAEWPGPPIERRPEPAGSAGFVPTARGRAMPGDLDESGVFSLGAFVHRFTDACWQALAAIGMDAGFMARQRRGYSTFELALAIAGTLRLGDPYRIETGIAHLGNSSIRLTHRLSDPKSGKELAWLGQFGVLLDLDARRPAPVPDEIRARAQRLLVAPG
ncbi:MAG: thioesterase family protein [Acetobacteraceae bacterium]